MKEQVIVRTYPNPYTKPTDRIEALLSNGYTVAMTNPYYGQDGGPRGNEYILERKVPDKPNEKKGEWKRVWEYDHVVSDYDCTACGKSFTATKELIESYHFCPNCGADMRKAVLNNDWRKMSYLQI